MGTGKVLVLDQENRWQEMEDRLREDIADKKPGLNGYRNSRAKHDQRLWAGQRRIIWMSDTRAIGLTDSCTTLELFCIISTVAR
jgi:hypothetical protein